MTVTDGTTPASDTSTVYFRDRRYVGLTNVISGISDAQIRGLASASLATSRMWGPTAITPVGDDYIWVCYPSSMGTATFKIEGLSVTGWSVTTGDFVNAYGYTNTYLKYRSPQYYTVAIELEVE